MELEFPHCKNQDFDVKLKSINEKTAILSGTIYDANGAVIPSVKITAINKLNKSFESKNLEDGT
jgi:hypothetical protein